MGGDQQSGADKQAWQWRQAAAAEKNQQAVGDRLFSGNGMLRAK